MEFNYNFVSFLDAVGFIQGLTLGTIILLINRNRHKSTFFLGLFLIVFSLKLLRYIAIGLEVEKVYPNLFLLPFDFSWLLFPLFFVYCHKISFFSNQNTKYWVLIPGILAFIAQVIIFFLPYETKLDILDGFWYEFVFTYLGIFYAWGIGVWNLIFLIRHKKAVNNFYSVVEYRELNWAQVFLIYSLISSWIIHLLFYFEPENFYFRLIFAVFDLVAISWISVFGLQQHNTHTLLSMADLDQFPPKNSASEKSQNLPILDHFSLQKIMEDVEGIMVEERLFLNKNLTIIDIAQALDLHPKKISVAINKIQNKNFNNYVNGHRVTMAKQMLMSYRETNLSIEGIGSESGFKSKSAFYSSFKRVTGLTPTNYKNQFSMTA